MNDIGFSGEGEAFVLLRREPIVRFDLLLMGWMVGGRRWRA